MSETPFSIAFSCAFSMFGGKTSKPKYFELGYFFASSMLDLPVPQPKSAKVTPFSSFSVISGILSVQSVTRNDLYHVHPVRSNPSHSPDL